MKTNAIQLDIGILLLTISIMIALIVSGSRGAETAKNTRPLAQGPSGELHQLLKTRYDLAASLLETEEKKLDAGRSTLMTVYEAARRVRESALDLPGQPEEQLAALTQYLAVTRRLEDSMNRAAQNGVASSSDRDLAHYLRTDAEIALLRLKLQRDGAR